MVTDEITNPSATMDLDESNSVRSSSYGNVEMQKQAAFGKGLQMRFNNTDDDSCDIDNKA